MSWYPFQLLDTLKHDSETQKNYMETQCEELEVGLDKFLDIIEHKLVIPYFYIPCQAHGAPQVDVVLRVAQSRSSVPCRVLCIEVVQGDQL